MSNYYQACYKTEDGVSGVYASPTQTKEDLLEEISSFIDEMEGQVVIRITKIPMSEIEFEKLPEFEGY